MAKRTIRFNDNLLDIAASPAEHGETLIEIGDTTFPAKVQRIGDNIFSITYQDQQYTVYLAADSGQTYAFVNGSQFLFETIEKSGGQFGPGADTGADDGNEITAPMPGKILKMFVEEGQEIKKNDRLFILEAMKMENEVKASRDGIIKKVHFQENDLVSVGQPVIELSTEN